MMNTNVTQNLSKALPSTVQALLRKSGLKRIPTTRHCEGYTQANLVILPSSLADDFGKFAKGNSGAVPLLHTSKPGDFGAPGLCEDSDVRTDLPLYNVIKNGVVVSQVENLKDFDLSDMVTFYIGCSFSFYKALINHGVTTAKQPGENVSMYTTDVDCFHSGPFKCKMVVSMQPVHESKLNLATDVTNSLKDVHGGPIHFGNPDLIGIEDVTKVSFGDPVEIAEGFVPVFWCCGVTGLEALRSANCDLSFTHAPGHMFITDLLQSEPNLEQQPPHLSSEVIKFSDKRQQYSVLSKQTKSILEKLASITEQDPGKRGIRHLAVPGDFLKASLALSHARSVALITGFPVNDLTPPDETDGLPGIFSLAAALQAANKEVSLIVDLHTLEFNQTIAKRCRDLGMLPRELHVVPYLQDQDLEKQLYGSERRYDVILASERVGRGQDGCYYGMLGKNLTDRVSPIDDLYETASRRSDVVTVAIGDGGNELGMGKVIDQVRKNIPLGDKIACVAAGDLVLATGTCNWGCYALGIALYALKSCPIHERYLRKAVGFPEDTNTWKEFLPSVARERKILEIVEEFGVKDGRSPNQVMSVDGMYFDEKHSEIIRCLRSEAGL